MLPRLEERGKELRQLSQEQGRVVQPELQTQTREEALDTGSSARSEGLKHTDFPSSPVQSLADAALWSDDREPARARTPVSTGIAGKSEKWIQGKIGQIPAYPF